MIDEFAKTYLHDNLRWVRADLIDKVEGLSEYDVRRPLTYTGTNLLGLIKHLTLTEARYLGELFNRPYWPAHQAQIEQAARRAAPPGDWR
ncbi:MAG TPA: DUF664 domain-containing protein [Kribbella sp.]|nr:DUF664 domain-containing protein [Kribbella sp.]